MAVVKNVGRWMTLGCALMGTSLVAQTTTASAAPASPSATQEQPEPPKAPKAPKPPKTPRASTHVMRLGSGSFLGVDIEDVTSDRVSKLKLPDESGVEITTVD